MAEWRWTNTRVLEDWASTHDRSQVEAVILALKEAEAIPMLPGDPVESPPGRERRVIRIPEAHIYFAPPQTRWNATRDCLFLLDIDSS